MDKIIDKAPFARIPTHDLMMVNGNTKEYCKCSECKRLRERRDRIYGFKYKFIRWTDRPANRFKILALPLIICISGMIWAWIRSLSGFALKTPVWFFILFGIGVLLLIALVLLITWTDNKRDKIYG